jgi:hypothetical protein
MRSLRILAFLSVISVLSMASLSWGQTGTSTIRGTVTDPSGSVVSGATVTLTNTQTNTVRNTKTGPEGTYVFDLIIPATYKVTVEATGFKQKVVQNVQALIGKPTTTDIALEVGAVNQVVEVSSSGQAALVNTQDATLGNNFDSLQITQLPLEARNLVDLLSLQPGSTREGYVTGARADQSNVTLDGVDINNAQTGNAEIPRSTNSLVVGALDNDRGDITSGPVLRLNSEAVEEFRVTTANGNANQGRSSGAQINIVTKQGTNAWHGAASEFYRSRGFTANDWFNNHSTPTVERPPLTRNTFEAALGGPVVKNKLFFFYDYAGRRDASSQSVSRIVPLPNLGQGIIKYLYCNGPNDTSCTTPASLDLTANNVYPAVGLNPAALAALGDAAAKFPNNDLTNGDQLNTGGFRFNAPTPVRLNAHTLRLDANLNQKQSLFARLQVQDDHQTLPQWLPGSVSPVVWAHNWGLAVGHTWTIGSNWVNNFRYGLTRQAYTNSGDSFADDTEFRFVFQPNGQLHPLTQVVPVHNFTDDLSWVRGKHTIQFGGNIRMVSNKRSDFFASGDFAEMNPSYYNGAGSNVKSLFQGYLTANNLPGGTAGQSVSSTREVRDAATSIIGRYTQLQSFFNFSHDGSLLPHSDPSGRDFASQSYDEYVQDTWKVFPSLTLTLGLRYSLERPVYEKNGLEVQPIDPLGKYLAQRVAAANQGQNLTTLITLDKSGPANGRKPMYNWDKNNFQPRIAAAWSPDNGKTSVRGGFAMTNDYFGQALAVDFDLNSSIGFVENFLNHANTYDVTGNPNHPPGPQFQQFGDPVRPLIGTAGGVVPTNLMLPGALPSLNGTPTTGEVIGERIEQSLDSALHSPTQYTWNFTIERQVPKGGVFAASYIGRLGRSLLARRDVAQFNNLRDPATGMDWYTAATALEKLRQQSGADVAINQVPNLPANVLKYFDDMFPAGLAQILQDFDYGAPCNSTQAADSGWDCNWSNAQAFMAYSGSAVDFYTANDWTDYQADVDNALAFTADPINGDPKAMRFMQPQFGSLSTWSSIGNSNYHALTLSFRQRLKTLTLDFNYTFAHSLDDASGLQSEAGYGNFQTNGSFIPNSLRQHDNYGSSDFDVRHSINADFVWQLPIGRGQAFMGNAGKAADALLGGWQLSSIIRWNTGLPTGVSPFDESQWANSWNVQSNTTPTSSVHSCPNKPKNSAPKIFGGCDVTGVYQSMRNAYPGESGPRNYVRYPGYFDLDLGISKSFKMPWEGHQLALRWDVFNVTNTQSLTGIVDFAVVADPKLTQQTPPPDWGNFFQIQGQPRVMQIGARYSF